MSLKCLERCLACGKRSVSLSWCYCHYYTRKCAGHNNRESQEDPRVMEACMGRMSNMPGRGHSVSKGPEVGRGKDTIKKLKGSQRH